MRYVLAVVLVCFAVAMCGAAAPAPPASASPAPQPALSAGDYAKAVEVAIERAAEQVCPAVVNITILRETSGEMWSPDDMGLPPDWPPEDLRDFFERLRRRPPRSYRAMGNGSGVVISADGFILTSEHVIRDSTEIEVTLSTRKKYKAKVVGSDPRRDLAVIRIEAKDLPVARLGDAAQLRRGQFVLALGSPFGFGRDGQASLSFGIVSGTGRAILGIGRELDRYYGNLIQTDAAVNPGNSGGPLINLDGEVVGINAVISSQTGSSDGVGFAVPISVQTRDIIERLKRGEEIAYGYIGVEIQEVGEDEAKQTGAELGQGAYVGKVLPDTPGAKAGLRAGDVIVSVGQTAVHDPDDVIQVVQSTPVGQKVTLTVLRKGKREDVAVEVARRPAPREVLAAREVGEWWRGMRVEPLTDELRQQSGLKEADRGAFVKEVRDGSPAAEAGIVPGMVIDQVGEKKVASVKEFKEAVAEVEGPCFVHVAGIGVKVIQPPGAAKGDKPDKSGAPPVPEKPRGKGGKRRPAEKVEPPAPEKPTDSAEKK